MVGHRKNTEKNIAKILLYHEKVMLYKGKTLLETE